MEPNLNLNPSLGRKMEGREGGQTGGLVAEVYVEVLFLNHFLTVSPC